MIRSVLFAGVACLSLAACGGGGVTIGGAAAPSTEAEKAAMATEIASRRLSGTHATVKRLEERVAELERLLTELRP